MSYAAKYVARHMLFGQETLWHAPSMAELQGWAAFHNMIIGVPKAGTPYFSVEHADGSRLTEGEHERIAATASVANHAARQRVVSHIVYGPEDGLIHTAIARALRSRTR